MDTIIMVIQVRQRLMLGKSSYVHKRLKEW